jgi:hypothetical protein
MALHITDLVGRTALTLAGNWILHNYGAPVAMKARREQLSLVIELAQAALERLKALP